MKCMGSRLLNVLGVGMWIVLVPVLVINMTLMVKGWLYEDEVASVGGYVPLIVLTDSMSPVIDSGDLIVCRDVDVAEVGDVISYFDPSSHKRSIVTHRVLEIINENDEVFYRTKGDNNNIEDKELVNSEDVVGEYVFRVNGLGSLILFMQSSNGVWLLLGLVVLIGVCSRWYGDKCNQQELEGLRMELELLKKKS